MYIMDENKAIRLDGYDKIRAGFEWRLYPHQHSGGVLSGLLGGDKALTVDCDGSAILCDSKGDPIGESYKDCCVYYGNLDGKAPWILHRGDNQTGIGHGDDEEIAMDLSQIPKEVGRIIFTVDFFKARNYMVLLGKMREIYIRLVDEKTEEEICRFDLTERSEGSRIVIAGVLDRITDEAGSNWQFTSVGAPMKGDKYRYRTYAQWTKENYPLEENAIE